MNTPNATSVNRTGLLTSPKFASDLVEGAEASQPSSEGDALAIAAMRDTYQRDPDASIGSIPPGREAEVVASLLIDKLGERLVFERMGTRLYEVLIQKHQTEEIVEQPSADDLARHHREELAHFDLLRDAIERLGGDPTVETPAADIWGVASRGAGEVLRDPRTTFRQCLDVILMIELADNDAWSLLAKIATAAGESDLAESCLQALREEQEHLDGVRRWVEAHTLARPAGEASDVA